MCLGSIQKCMRKSSAKKLTLDEKKTRVNLNNTNSTGGSVGQDWKSRFEREPCIGIIPG